MISLYAARLGFIEKCASEGFQSVDTIACAMAISELQGEFDKYAKEYEENPNVQSNRPEYEAGNTLYGEGRNIPQQMKVKEKHIKRADFNFRQGMHNLGSKGWQWIKNRGGDIRDMFTPSAPGQSRLGMLDTKFRNIPSKYGGGLIGMGLGAGLGSLIGRRLFNSPWLGALVGAGGLGYLGQHYGQNALSRLSKYFTPTTGNR